MAARPAQLVPVPDNGTNGGFAPCPTSMNVVPLLAPVLCGVNVIVIVQLAPADICRPQVSLSLKSLLSAPPMPVLVTVIVTALLLVTVICLGWLVVPTF